MNKYERLVKKYIPRDCCNDNLCPTCPVFSLAKAADLEFVIEFRNAIGLPDEDTDPCIQVLQWNNKVLEAKKLKAILQ
jgi:hypothetical protein